jgi:predicted DNA-binding transcriptional regulator AlpA
MARRSEVYSRSRAVHGLADQIETIDHAIKAKELARLLGISVPQMYKLGKTTIPSFRLGTGVRFDPHSVAEWLRNEA